MEPLQNQGTQKENLLRQKVNDDDKEERDFLNEKTRYYGVPKVNPGGITRNKQNCCHRDYFNSLLKCSEYQRLVFRNDRAARLPP